MMVRNVLLGVLTVVLGGQAFGQDSAPAKASSAMVQSVGFTYGTPQSRFEILLDKGVTFEKNVSEADKQVIIDIPNATIGKKWNRRIDTSQHKSNVVMISPYQSENRVRVSLQLKENGGVDVTQDGNKLIVLIDNKQPDTGTPDLGKDLTSADKKSDSPDAVSDSAPVGTKDKNKESMTASSKVPVDSNPTTPTAADDKTPQENPDTLNSFFKAQETKHWMGKRIFLQVQDTDIADVFRIISEASEFNIVLSESVKGKVMLNLTDVPWDQALDLILRSEKLAAERDGNILRITTMADYTAAQSAEAASKKVQVDAEPLVVKIFPISYAKVDILKAIIIDFMTKADVPANGAALAGAAATRGSIQTDLRTNSLIIRDTPTAMERIRRIIKELDSQTPQVLIEGKFVQVNEGGSSNINGQLFVSNRELDPAGSGNLIFGQGNNNYFGGFNNSGPISIANAIAGGAPGGGTFGFVPKTALLPGIGEIGALLSVIESEHHGKVIASPRVVTQNKETATISQGSIIQYATAGGVGTAGGITTVTATLTLTVTPQVTNDGSIVLKIAFEQDSPDGTPAVPGATSSLSTKSVNTNVIVDSGATLVIGGIYQQNDSLDEAGIPILRNLPIIGALFGNKVKSSTRNELFIFLTPRILNEKESGLKG